MINAVSGSHFINDTLYVICYRARSALTGSTNPLCASCSATPTPHSAQWVGEGRRFQAAGGYFYSTSAQNLIYLPYEDVVWRRLTDGFCDLLCDILSKRRVYFVVTLVSLSYIHRRVYAQSLVTSASVVFSPPAASAIHKRALLWRTETGGWEKKQKNKHALVTGDCEFKSDTIAVCWKPDPLAVVSRRAVV